MNQNFPIHFLEDSFSGILQIEASPVEKQKEENLDNFFADEIRETSRLF